MSRRSWRSIVTVVAFAVPLLNCAGGAGGLAGPAEGPPAESVSAASAEPVEQMWLERGSVRFMTR